MVSAPFVGMKVMVDGRIGTITDYSPSRLVRWRITVRFDEGDFGIFIAAQVDIVRSPEEQAHYEDQLKRQQYADKYL